MGILSQEMQSHSCVLGSPKDLCSVLSACAAFDALLCSGHKYDEALEALGSMESLLQGLRVPKKSEIWVEVEELRRAVQEAMGIAAAEAGSAGKKM